MPKGPDREITSRSGLSSSVAFAAAVAILGIAYLVCIDEVAGLYVDDAWYVLLAKALAEGNGFTLINAPAAGVMPFYPPGFSAVLALVFVAAPGFPRNVWLLKLVSIGAAIGAAVLLRHYFLQVRRISPWAASGLATLALACPLLHFLVTSAVMAEATFLLVQTAALIAIARCALAGSPRQEIARGLLAGLLVGAGTLVRTQGAPLVLAALFDVAWRRGLRGAAAVGCGAAALIVPWQIHVWAHAPSVAQRAAVNDAIAWPYTEHFWMSHAGHTEFGQDTIRDLPARFARSAATLATGSLGALYLSPGIASLLRERSPAAGAAVGFSSLLLSALTLVGLAHLLLRSPTAAEIYTLLSLGLLVAWPFPPDRMLVPLLPLLAFHAAHGLGEIARWARPAGTLAARAPLALIGLLLALNSVSLAFDVADARGAMPAGRTMWRRAFAENMSLLAWVRSNVSPHAVVATHNVPLVYLYTGLRTVGSWEDATNEANWRAVGARYWVDSTMARYRHPDMMRRGLSPRVLTPTLRLGVYRLPSE